MALASGTSVGLSYVAETTHGTTPGSPSMKTLRSTSRNINGTKGTLSTNEVRSDRQIADVRHGFNSVAGSVGFELSVEAYDDLLEAALGGAWATGGSTAATTLSTAATGNKITRATGSFITDGHKVGHVVALANSATQDGNYTITAVSALEVTVLETVTTEAGDGDETLALVGKVLDVGNTLTTFTFERLFTDIAKYQVYRGCAINSMSMSIIPEEIVGGTFDIVGMSFADFSGTSLGVPAAAPTNSPLAAFDGALVVDGVEVAVVTAMDFTVTNNRNVQAVVGNKFSPDVFDGQFNLDGNMTVFLEDSSLFYGYFNDETEFRIQMKLDDVDGTGFISFNMPRCKATAADIDPPQEGPVSITMPFKALVDETNSLDTLIVQRSNV